jgi:hypothetical protein
MQLNNYNQFYAIAYCSKISTSESKLPAIHSELGAIIYALNIFKPIIYQF